MSEKQAIVYSLFIVMTALVLIMISISSCESKSEQARYDSRTEISVCIDSCLKIYDTDVEAKCIDNCFRIYEDDVDGEEITN